MKTWAWELVQQQCPGPGQRLAAALHLPAAVNGEQHLQQREEGRIRQGQASLPGWRVLGLPAAGAPLHAVAWHACCAPPTAVPSDSD